MPRQLTLPTRELGTLSLFVIYQKGDSYEPEWKPLQGHPLTKLFTVVSKTDYDHALKGWTLPLIRALGLEPKLTLLKIPTPQTVCFERVKCPLYAREECAPRAEKMPWCFQPDGIEDPLARQLAGEAIRLWREQVYIVVVQEPETSFASARRR